jgi:NTE family protein
MLINGVFEGGGVKGIALVGAIAAAEQANLRFHQIAGTSAGALVGALLAAGYDAEEMKRVLGGTDFMKFVQPTWWHKCRPLGPLLRLLLKQGLYSPDPLEQWLAGLLRKKGVQTFADLPPDRLRVVASDISLGRLLVLPADLAQYGVDPLQFPVARAVSLSARIPYFFDPGRIDGSTIVDGALLSNFPVWMFDASEHHVQNVVPTIGFQLFDKSSAGKQQIRGPLSMFRAIFATMMNAHDRRAMDEEQAFRAVIIPTLGVGVTQFDITKVQRMKLYEAGYIAGNAFFRRWDAAGYHKAFVKQAMTHQKKAGLR